MSENKFLLDFYKSYLNWVETGLSPYPFKSDGGLCFNLEIYFDSIQGSAEDYYYADQEMLSSFQYAGLHRHFPFDIDNDGGSSEGYTNYHKTKDKRQNKRRIQWVKDRVAGLDPSKLVVTYS